MATENKRMRCLIGSPSDWENDDLVIGDGELAIERDGNIIRLKVGDSIKTFSQLPWLVDNYWELTGNVMYAQNDGPVTLGHASITQDRLTVVGGDYVVGVYRDDIVTDNQVLGQFAVGAFYSAETPAAGALIRGRAVGDWSGTNYGASLEFLYTPENDTSVSVGFTLADDGSLLVGTQNKGASKLVVADDSIQILNSKTPISAADTGAVGQVAWDADYLYVCVGVDTWKRAALVTW